MSAELVRTDDGRYWVIEGEPGNYVLIEMQPISIKRHKHKYEARAEAQGRT
jgi:hypothetical protein